MVNIDYFPLITTPMSIETMLDFFVKGNDEVINFLSKSYGNDSEIIEDRRRAILSSLEEFQNVFPESRNVVLNRMPCRVNTQGNHIDHRGGTTNPVLHRREILSVASVREDKKVFAHDISEEYPPFSFDILEEMSSDETDWFEYIESESLQKWIAYNRQKASWWQSYVRAGVLGTCFLALNRKIDNINGMNIFINGDIPPGGLSSSSAVVMVSLLSFCQLNRIEVDRERFVDIAGDAEWYVGSRGGKGDHAAIIFTKQGTISHPSFMPLEITRFIPYPKKADFVIVNSARNSQKTTAEKSIFNTRVATYEAAQLFLWKIVDDFFHIPLLRDVFTFCFSDQTLFCKKSLNRFNVLDKENKIANTINLYNLLKQLPVVSSYDEVMASYEDYLADRGKNLEDELERLSKIKKLIARFDRDDEIQIRQVALFGLAEMARAQLHGDYLIEENYEEVGRLMNASHDGDRKFVLKEDGYVEFPQDFSDREFDRLIENLQSGKENLVRESFLESVPGGYSCSCIELDMGVDIALKTEGTYGAKMVGGGLGGNFIVLSSNSEILLKTLAEKYFQPRKEELEGEIFYDNKRIVLESYNRKQILAEVVVPVEAGGPIA